MAMDHEYPTLTEKQAAFVREYLIDLNATQAAIRAGYSEKTAEVIGYENLNKPQISEILDKARKQRVTATKIDAAYVMTRLAEIDAMDVLDILNDDMSFKPLREWPKVWRQTLSGVDIAEMFEGSGDSREMVGLLKKIKWPDKVKNLELLGKHIGVQAFSEKKQIEVTGLAEILASVTGAALTVQTPEDDTEDN